MIAALDDLIPEILYATQTPGLAVTVSHHGDVVYSKGFGLADIGTQEPMTTTALTRAASISKVYVATAIMQLAEGGQVDLYAPIGHYLPDIQVTNPFGARAVTIFDLLTHTSGLRTDTIAATLDGLPPLQDYLATVFRSGRGAEYDGHGALWTSPVGSRYQYSSLGIATLGLVISNANPGRVSFEQYVAERIFQPLAMRASRVGPRDAERRPQPLSSCMTGYARIGSRCIPSPWLRSAIYPATGLLTSTEEHVRWLEAMLQGGYRAGRRILTANSVRAMLVPHSSGYFPGETPGLWMGLGVQMRNLGRDDFYFGHGAYFPYGWCADSRAYPSVGVAVAAASNVWDVIRYMTPFERTAPGIIADWVARIMLSPSPNHPDPHKRDRAWRTSFASGLLLCDRLRGVLGLRDRLSSETVDRMVSDAHAIPGPRQDLWDADGFRTGLMSLAHAPASPADVSGYIDSPACPVSRFALDLFALSAGATRPSFPAPMPFFAERSEEDLEKYAHLSHIGEANGGLRNR
jgi:CubicO group peptidase (beta-lactamase class C family)